MKTLLCAFLSLVAVCRLGADEKKPDVDPYADLFSFPAKITLDEQQKDKLYLLRKEYESTLSAWDTAKSNVEIAKVQRDKLARLIVRKKNVILTEEQRNVLGIRIITPPFAQRL